MERKLAAILAADVVGYSRLMEQDEVGTFERLKAHRKELFEPEIEKHRGRIFKLMGDGLLAEFASAVNAAECALALQRGMAARNRGQADDRRIDLRIGINLGDVIIDGEDFYGEGVNIAARLQQLADPSRICLSGDVYRQVRGKVDAVIEDLGERKVKNVAAPVRVYRLNIDGPAVPAADMLQLPDKPSIAVLPFDNANEDPDQDFFADGITEDIITDLSRFRSLFVIARSSSFSYRGRAVGAKQIGKELGVRYVLRGSVRRAGDMLRITAELVDAETDIGLWAERYDRPAHDVFKLLDEVAGTIVATMMGRLEDAVLRQARRKPVASLAAYELVLRGKQLLRSHRREDELAARRLFEDAANLDPDYAIARVQLALTHLQEFFWDNSGEALDRTAEIATEALLLDDGEAWCHMVLGLTHLHRRRFDLALRHCEKSVSLNPNDPGLAARMGLVLTDLGRPEEAIVLIAKAMRLDPLKAESYYDYLGLTYFAARRYEEAVRALQATTDPTFYVHVWLAACYAQLGDLPQAQQHGARVSELAPYFTVSRFARMEPIRRPDDLEHWLSALRLAGIPE